MAVSSTKTQEYTIRILKARMSLMARNGFYGILLMHIQFALDESVGTAATDGVKMYFAPSFLDVITDRELVFVMQHEILHVVLRHCLRTGERDNFLFNVACDIVVNSTILESNGNDVRSISLQKYGESMHIAPDGKEGRLYTAEEVYEMLEKDLSGSRGSRSGGFKLTDNHSKWGTSTEPGLEELWEQRLREAYEAAQKGRGNLPAGLKRAIEELLEPVTDWRTLLNDFVQEELVDYSFTPPDRRFPDSPFFLPDFNVMDEVVRNVLFMIDTSGSMTKKEITQAYSEVKGAIDQYSGRLEGWLGFFDEEVIKPLPFMDEQEFKLIRPYGGGGTSFEAVFNYIRDEMAGLEITSIIILTDGYAPFPPESAAMGIPVLWLINNKQIDPPWGRIVRI
ncbi:MAG: hypothetical protein IJH43_09425 [Mogibacterium sp.]|nr:hypothetical protein [Mogibacterium sp.]